MAKLAPIHVHIHVDTGETLAVVRDIQQKVNTMATDLSALTAKVEENAAVDQSAIVLLQGLKAALDAAGTDPAALAALSASLGGSSAALAAAVAANTPAAPAEPTPAPVEEPAAPADTAPAEDPVPETPAPSSF